MQGSQPSNLYLAYRRHFPSDRSKVLLTTESGKTYTYEDAEIKSAQMANYLASLELLPGDRVTVQVEKSPEMLWLYLATLRAGMVFHPLNTAYTVEELEYFEAEKLRGIMRGGENTQPEVPQRGWPWKPGCRGGALSRRIHHRPDRL
jgi:acyl-CoA synthetase (AMP-forming)/AMP-acid ligase II